MAPPRPDGPLAVTPDGGDPPPVLGPGAGVRELRARGSVMWFKALAAQDGGDLSLMERTLPPGGRRPPPHRHTNDLWNRDDPPSVEEERALMARFGMEPA